MQRGSSSVGGATTSEPLLIELPSYEVETTGKPGKGAIEAYERDGVVCLRNAFDLNWVERLCDAVDTAISDGLKKGGELVVNVAEPGKPGFFFYDMFLWQRYDLFREFAFSSPAADLALHIMRSESIIFYYDLVLSKEPGTTSPTPWHYDEAYWPVSGTQICNLWTALDPIPRETALRFVRGSHQLTSDYRAVGFSPDIEYSGQHDPEPPDWGRNSNDHEIVYAPLKPGDCLIINCRTHHSAPGNPLRSTRRRALATHWLGDDARYNNKSRECDPDERGNNLQHGGSMECKTFPRVR